MKLKAGAVIIPFPEAAVDVDSVDDWWLTESIVSGRSLERNFFPCHSLDSFLWFIHEVRYCQHTEKTDH